MGRAYATTMGVRHDGVRYPAGVEIDLDRAAADALLAAGAVQVIEGAEIDAGWSDGKAPHEGDGETSDMTLEDAVAGLSVSLHTKAGAVRKAALDELTAALGREIVEDDVAEFRTSD